MPATSLYSAVRRFLGVLLCVALSFSVLCVAPCSAWADEGETKTVRVGWLVNNQGFQSGTPGEYLSGWGYEYLQTLSYYTSGWKYEYVTGTFGELMDKLEAGEIDLMPNISYTDERAQKMLFSSNPEGTERYYIYAKPTQEALAKGDPTALNGMTIGCNNGVMQTEVGMKWLQDAGISCNYKFYETGDELFDALSSDKVDAIIMNDTLSSEDAMAMFYVGESNYYFVTPKSRPDLMDDINAAMTSLRSTNPRYNDEVKTRYSVSNGGSSSLTAKEQSWLDAHNDTINIGYMDKSLPYTNRGENGLMEGALSPLCDTLRTQFGAKLNETAYASNAELEDALKSGEIDMALPVYKDYWLAEQSGTIQSSTLATTSFAAVYSGDNLEEALGNIAYYPGSLANRNALSVLYPDASLLSRKDDVGCVNAVKSGEASCTIVPISFLDTLRDRVDMSGLKTTQLPANVGLNCRMRKGDSELLSIVDKGIVCSSGAIEAATYSHYSYSNTDSDFAQFVEKYQTTIVACVIALLVLVIAVLAWALNKARVAQQEAQSANAAKTAFLSRMSHDIRTPLNGIIGLIEVNDLHADDVELTKRNRSKAKVAADHLLTLISDILEMSMIEDREIVLENKPFNLTNLFRDVLVLANIRAAERGVTITTDGGRNIKYPDVYGSPMHVRRVMLNLVDNCVKYNRKGGTVNCVSVLLGVKGDVVTYRFIISDTGIGMSQEFLKHIFEPFAQENDDARSNFQGTGMGMPIVKALVERMGGTISVESEEGKGSVFTIDVPFTIDREPERHRVAPLGLEDCSISGMNIMLAEDNELNTEVANALLTSEGAVVTCVPNGKEALELFCKKPAGSFDAILMDIMMPVMDGYEAARAIRVSDKRDAATVPIIAMTANAFFEDAKAAKEAGMNAHIAKPIDLAVVKRTIAECCLR